MGRYFHPHHHRFFSLHKIQHRYWVHLIDIFDADESTTNVSRCKPCYQHTPLCGMHQHNNPYQSIDAGNRLVPKVCDLDESVVISWWFDGSNRDTHVGMNIFATVLVLLTRIGDQSEKIYSLIYSSVRIDASVFKPQNESIDCQEVSAP